MKKIHILKENTEFNRILNCVKPFRTKYFSIFLEKTNDDNFYFGFTVGKKLGRAVDRNKIKRRIKNILNNKKYKNGFKCIIMPRKEFLTENYKILEEELINTLKRFDLFL